MGLIYIASNLRLLPPEFANLWPLIAITVGLGGILTSDRVEWLIPERTTKSRPAKSAKSRRGR